MELIVETSNAVIASCLVSPLWSIVATYFGKVKVYLLNSSLIQLAIREKGNKFLVNKNFLFVLFSS